MDCPSAEKIEPEEHPHVCGSDMLENIQYLSILSEEELDVILSFSHDNWLLLWHDLLNHLPTSVGIGMRKGEAWNRPLQVQDR